MSSIGNQHTSSQLPAVSHIKDLREFIDALRALGDLQDVEREVDWELEIGAIIRHSYDLRASAPLFATITGYRSEERRVGKESRSR